VPTLNHGRTGPLQADERPRNWHDDGHDDRGEGRHVGQEGRGARRHSAAFASGLTPSFTKGRHAAIRDPRLSSSTTVSFAALPTVERQQALPYR